MFNLQALLLLPIELLTEIKNNPKGVFKSLLQAFGFVLVINWTVARISVVPTKSMADTIVPGDVVIVSPSHYGAKTLQTLLHMPLTQEKIPLINIRSYSTWIQLPVYSLPGFSKPKRGDCVVIKHPATVSKANVPTDVQVPFLKRIIGMPKDRFSIVNGKEHANGQPVKCFAKYQYKYIIKTDQRLPNRFFKKNGITDYEYLATGGVEVYICEDEAARLSKIAGIDGVVRVIQKKTDAEMNARFAMLAGGNKDHISEFIIPYKGMEVAMNKRNIGLYLDVIQHYEVGRNAKVVVDGGVLWVEGKKVERWVFKQNYYMVMGDNRDNSYDSRAFGLVPEIDMLGKALMILMSGKNPKRHPMVNLLMLNIRWRRTGQIIR